MSLTPKPTCSLSFIMPLLAMGSSFCEDPDAAEKGNIIAAFRAKYISVNWIDRSIIYVDIDDDGDLDAAMIGLSDSEISIGVLRQALKKKSMLDCVKFQKGEGLDDSYFVVRNVHIKPETLDYAIESIFGNSAAKSGFRQSKSGKGFTLSDGMTDSLHFYWDHLNNRMSWWRL